MQLPLAFEYDTFQSQINHLTFGLVPGEKYVIDFEQNTVYIDPGKGRIDMSKTVRYTGPYEWTRFNFTNNMHIKR